MTLSCILSVINKSKYHTILTMKVDLTKDEIETIIETTENIIESNWGPLDELEKNEASELRKMIKKLKAALK